MAFVLDSSVALAWVLPDESSPAADGLVERLLREEVVVPPLWPLEVGNVLITAMRRARLAAPDVERIAADLRALPVTTDPSCSREALARSLSLALRRGLTTYDAAYLELAQRRNIPLATLDARLREACVAEGVAVLP